MTTSTMTSIPLAIGAGIAGLAARGGHWCFEKMARSPMGSTAFVLVTGLTLMAGTNALFLQQMRHPAPMFTAAGHTPAAIEVPVPPPVRPVVVAPEPAAQPAVASQPAAQPAVAEPEPTQAPIIGNADIAELQEKLKAMGLFDGTVDGFYGPKTADAIRAFEQRAGLPRTGAASPQVIQAVRNASINTSEAASPMPPAPAAAEPAPAEVVAQVVAEPAQAELNALIAELEAPAPATSAPAEPQESVAEAALFDPASASAATSVPAALDRELVSEIQRGLSRLGFLQAPVDGVPGESTALAIRKFQVFNNFPPTGEVSPAVLDMLVAAGAYM